jgi:hypothetical protein
MKFTELKNKVWFRPVIGGIVGVLIFFVGVFASSGISNIGSGGDTAMKVGKTTYTKDQVKAMTYYIGSINHLDLDSDEGKLQKESMLLQATTLLEEYSIYENYLDGNSDADLDKNWKSDSKKQAETTMSGWDEPTKKLNKKNGVDVDTVAIYAGFYAYLKGTMAEAVKKEEPVTDKEVNDFYAENKDSYKGQKKAIALESIRSYLETQNLDNKLYDLTEKTDIRINFDNILK